MFLLPVRRFAGKSDLTIRGRRGEGGGGGNEGSRGGRGESSIQYFSTVQCTLYSKYGLLLEELLGLLY